MKKNIIGLVVIALALISILFASPVLATGKQGSETPQLFERSLGSGPPPHSDPASQSTPQLIQAALKKNEINHGQAQKYLRQAFDNYRALPARFQSNVPWDGTLHLLELEAAGALSDLSMNTAPTAASAAGTCGSSTSALPNLLETEHFRIEYADIGGGLTIQDYAAVLERSWEVEVDYFGWAAPPPLPTAPLGNPRYLVRVDGLSGGLYGYVSTSGNYAGFVQDNPNTSWNEGDAYASCMVLNKNYGTFPSTALTSLKATAAHEFHHSIQFGYGALSGAHVPDPIFAEGSATWVEDEVFNEADDNYNFLWPDFRSCMGAYGASPYGYWIVFRGMTETFGAGSSGGAENVMQLFWEITSREQAGNLEAMNTALRSRGTNLADAYHNFAIAARFNRACAGGYGYPYCLAEGPAYEDQRGSPIVQGSIASIGEQYAGAVQDNYALNWIDLPGGDAPFTARLTNSSNSGQLRASLVCDTGSELRVTPFSDLAGPGENVTVQDYSGAGCQQVVAVITNQAQTGSNPTSCVDSSYSLQIDPSSGPANPQPTPLPATTRDGYRIFLPVMVQS